ncbi:MULTISPECIES: hypothetical protein [Chitinophagaceae]
MMIRRLIIILPALVIALFSCHRKHSAIDKLISINKMMYAKIPSDALYIEDTSNSIDSHSAIIVLKDGDTLQIESGHFGIIDDLYQGHPSVFPLSQKDFLSKRAGRPLRSSEVLFSEFPERDEKENTFDDNYYIYDTLHSGIIGKVVIPKRTGRGITGIFVPHASSNMALSIYGVNLDSISQHQALLIFKTISPYSPLDQK